MNKKTNRHVNRKNLRAGSYSLVLTAVFLVMVVLLNVAVTALSEKFNLQVDMTQTRMFTLSSQTDKVLEEVDTDVYIYTFYDSGAEDMDIMQTINMYRSKSEHIKTEAIDMNRNPQMVQPFLTAGQSMQTSSLVVTNADKSRFRIITQDQQYERSYNSDGTLKMSQLVVENALTSAIHYVESGYMPNVYFLQGHDERALTDLTLLTSYLQYENYNMETVNLLTEPDKLKLGDTLVIAAPQKDLTEDERETLKAMIDKGGRFVFIFSPSEMMGLNLPNFESLLRIHGLELDRGVIAETNDNYRISTSPFILAPGLVSHDVTDSIINATTRVPVILFTAGNIRVPEMTSSDLTVTPILGTSSASWLESDLQSDAQQGEDELVGPFTPAATIHKTNYTGAEEDETRAVVIYSDSIISPEVVYSQWGAAAAETNMNLFINSLAWLSNSEENIYIRGKSLTQPALVFTSYSQIVILLILVCAVVPLVMFAGAIFIYFKRKNL